MKVVHVCTTAPWHERYAYQENLLPRYHRLMGHEVTIIAPIYSLIGYSKDGILPSGECFISDGIKVVRLLPLVKNITIDAHLHLVRGLKNAILKETPDLLFIHDVCSFNFLCVNSIKKRLPNVKIVMDNHSDLVNSLHSPITRFLHKIIYRYFLIPHLYKHVELFYGVTPSRCTFLSEVYHIPLEKIKLLIMGADDNKIDIASKENIRKEIREKYGISEDDFLIVTGGKIDKLKNIHVLAQAVSSLQKSNVKILIFGKIEDDVKEVFEAMTFPNIITIGWIDADKVYEYFYAADFVVFPGLHSVLWEQAVASGTPSAFSHIRGFEHVQVNGNCLLMENNTKEYYVNMINNLLDNPEFYNNLKKNSQSPLLCKFYYSKIAQQVLDDVGL